MRTKPRKPTRLRLIEGNPGHRPIPQTPQPAPAMPDPPPHLHAYALEKWREIAPELLAVELLTNLDGSVLAAFCQCHARWRLAEEKAAEMASTDSASGGLLARMPSGALVQSPFIGIANAAMKQMVRYAAELGLSPSARAGIEREDRKDNDRLATKYGLR